MTFLEESLGNLSDDMKEELSQAQELSLDDLEAVAGGGTGSDAFCCWICGGTDGLEFYDGHWCCREHHGY